jgi:predicted PurR-regulated permease PerM
MSSPSPIADRGSIERPLITLAASAVVIVGLKYSASVFSPVIFAVIATVTAYPIQRKLVDRGSKPLVAMLAAWGAIYAVFIAGAIMMAVALVQLVEELPQYESQISDALSWVSDKLGGSSSSSDILSNLDASNVVAVAQSVLGGVTGILGNAVVIVAVVFFLVIDALRFPDKYAAVSGDRGHVAAAWSKWGSETRVYLGVATIFGVIVAVIDSALLFVLGVPLVVVWGMLAFVTNYIPNIGFVIGVIPPALLAFLTDGWVTALWVVVGYSLINFTIQEFIQPKIVGDSVNLAATVTFVSVFFWTWVIGPLGAILCIPLTLFVRTVMLEPYESTRWLANLIDASGKGADPPEEVATAES